MSQLWGAILFGDMQLAKELVKAGIDLNGPLHCHPEKPSLLHAAIAKKDEKLALLMIERGADINARDVFGNSVLHAAVAWNSSVAFVKELLDKGARVDAVNLQNIDVIMLAVCQPTAAELLPILIEADFVDDTTRGRRGLKALFYLLTKDVDNIETMEVVLELGLPINELCNNGKTLLQNAMVSNKTDKIQCLLRYGADVNANSMDSIPLLFLALLYKNSTVVRLLIEKGANIHERYNTGEYPIHVACRTEYFENIQLLLLLGVDSNVVDKNGCTAFSMMSLVASNADAIVLFMRHFALLIEKGIKVRESDLDIIRRAGLQNVFDGYLRELQKAKQIKIYNDISFFSFLEKDVRELSLLLKNREIVKKYASTSLEMLFPYYNAFIQLKYKIAEKRKILLSSKLMFLEELFTGLLPDLVLEKIAFDLCHDQLNNLEFKYILSLSQ